MLAGVGLASFATETSQPSLEIFLPELALVNERFEAVIQKNSQSGSVREGACFLFQVKTIEFKTHRLK
jgi:hypothetical protein